MWLIRLRSGRNCTQYTFRLLEVGVQMDPERVIFLRPPQPKVYWSLRSWYLRLRGRWLASWWSSWAWDTALWSKYRHCEVSTRARKRHCIPILWSHPSPLWPLWNPTPLSIVTQTPEGNTCKDVFLKDFHALAILSFSPIKILNLNSSNFRVRWIINYKDNGTF